MNIFGDKKVWRNCKAKADILESNIHYCADCYALTIWNKPLVLVGQELDRKEGLTLKVVAP